MIHTDRTFMTRFFHLSPRLGGATVMKPNFLHGNFPSTSRSAERKANGSSHGVAAQSHFKVGS